MLFCPAYLKIPLLHLRAFLPWDFNTSIHILHSKQTCTYGTAVCRCCCCFWSRCFQRGAPSMRHLQLSIFFCFSFCYFEEVNSLKFAKTSKTKRKTEQKTSRYMRLVSPDLQRTRTGCLTVISVDIISNFIVNFDWHKYTIYEVVFLPFFYLGNLPYIFLSLCPNVPKNCLKLAYCVLQTCSLLIIFTCFFFTSDFVNEMMMFFSVFFFFAMLIHRLV